MSSIGNNLSSNSTLQSILNALQSAGVTTSAGGNVLSTIGSVGQQSDNSQLSPLAQLMNTLQQLQESNPAKYQQVTQQISTNLQNAAQTAQSDGNTAAANQLNQLATVFSNASQSGQLPSIQDLAQALAGGHHHHHHGGGASSSDSGSSTSSSSSSTSNNSATQTLSQFIASLQTSTDQSDFTQNSSLNPMAIIVNTLSNAGVTNNADNG